MGEARRDALRVGFDRAIKLEFQGAKVSSAAGLFPYRDLDEAAQLTDSSAHRLHPDQPRRRVQVRGGLRQRPRHRRAVGDEEPTLATVPGCLRAVGRAASGAPSRVSAWLRSRRRSGLTS